jgi:hypothetical protein
MSPAEIEAMVGKIGEFKGKLCDCPDEQCADNVQKDMQAWAKGIGPRMKTAKLTDDQTKRTQVAMQEMIKCSKRLMNMSGGE